MDVMSRPSELRIASHSVVLADSRRAVWEKLVNWHDWASWDRGMDWVKFDGPIAIGSVGQLKCKNGPKVQLRVTEFDYGNSYRSEFDLLGSKFIFDHSLIESEEPGVELAFAIHVTGYSSVLFASVLKPAFEKALPEWMNNFKTGLHSGHN